MNRKLKAPPPSKLGIIEFKSEAKNNLYQFKKSQSKEVQKYIKQWMKEEKNSNKWTIVVIGNKKCAFKNLRLSIGGFKFTDNPFGVSQKFTFHYDEFTLKEKKNELKRNKRNSA
jgi:hypothetical protein